MNEEIRIKVGGMYDMRERPQQVKLCLPNQLPIVFSHDKNIIKALQSAIEYIEHNYFANK